MLTLAVIVDLSKKFGLLRHPKPRKEMTMTDKRMALIELAEKLEPEKSASSTAYRPRPRRSSSPWRIRPSQAS
ncbi:hypothetical protein ACVDG8_026865 [Mesorhizobium sp. ORM8.1]